MPLETLQSLNYDLFILTVGIIGVDSHARDMYGNSHSQGACVLLEIPSMDNQYNIFRVSTCRNEGIYELKCVHIANFEVDLVQAVLNTAVDKMLIVYTNVLKNSVVLQQFMQCVTLLLIHVDTGLQELYLPLLVLGIHCTI